MKGVFSYCSALYIDATTLAVFFSPFMELHLDAIFYKYHLEAKECSFPGKILLSYLHSTALTHNFPPSETTSMLFQQFGWEAYRGD